MTNFEHLNKEQRDVIQHLINQRKSFTYIAQAINKDRTTISKEIRRNRYIKSKFYTEFDSKGINNTINKCDRLLRPPYVCNNCKNLRFCENHHLYYNSTIAQKHYEDMLSESRSGISLSYEQINEIENIIVPLIKDKKQSVNQVYSNHNDILPFSKVSFYTYVNDGVISLTNYDLPKKIKYKKRKKRKNISYKKNLIILKNRKYEDYLEFISKHPKMSKVQLDTVIGQRNNRKVLLTMYIVDTHFMLIFLLDKKTSENVTNIFKFIKQTIGTEIYKKLFRIILTDNGSEFMNPYEIEYDYETSKKISNVFYCRPYSSWQKHEIEVNHEYIRRVLPKGTNFSKLTNPDVKRLQDNINAIPRDSLNHKTPYELTYEKYPEFIKKLDIKYIQPDDVSLNKKDILKGGDNND